MKRKSDEFRVEAKAAPFELELEGGGTVVFRNPNKMTARDAFRLQKSQDPEESLRLLLGDNWVVFWAEWGDRPLDEMKMLNDAVGEHYGVGE